ncbi:MAG: UDP-N-acetylmuramate:L-alanyl-gamma-D-glutamyl-meso-diaminopimelate ligase [Candidatus Electryonea clarkiae]|nr:UDP-N-acetylmuramate:L-alanyl-gamma-D-glutamyl-meso-diaminopimelate ligase [Candidatus Electryonea clarkiae]MDP8285538.1 UDP-N-acetylmuramate:L-alanyl-gamma-D-glutamyl-meso-diaminopimelate ligase [Candidatus Electryonea clarkiae]
MVENISNIYENKIHFSGIGGTAMVAGARLALDLGWDVRGSDNPLYPPTSLMVEELGVPVSTGYDASNLDWNPDLVIIGNALSRGNPEVEAVLERKLHYVSLPEWLKDNVLRSRRPVVICGTHGKTTTTALTAHLLEQGGLNPGYFIGGQPLDFKSPSNLGGNKAPFVIEGDEYDTAFFDKRAKFFHYLPEIAVVTSLEFDHGDIYDSLDDIKRAFRFMLRQIPKSGWLILCTDNPGASELAEHSFSNVATYGFDKKADFRGEIVSVSEDFQLLKVYNKQELMIELSMPFFGKHNAQNTLAAVAVATILGVDHNNICKAVKSFKGVRRRMEIFLEAGGKTFVDDFAHHPTAIKETILATKQRWHGRKLRVLFEPRSNTTVSNRFQSELSDSFSRADEVWLGPVYRPDRMPEDQRLNRSMIINDLRKKGIKAEYSDDIEEIVNSICDSGNEGEVVLILSNGAFGGIHQRLKKVFERNRND